MRRPVVALSVLSLCLATTLRAQCPDGTPPPCAPHQTPPSPRSIAVLYFDNLSRDSADAYIADGLTDEVIVRLQHVQRLDVKSRYEARRFRRTRIADARSVGRELRVAWLVTGSVRPSAARMRVSYELVRTSDGRTIASDIVDTSSADQWAISNGVALAIARQVAGRLAPEERAALVRSPSRDARALDLYRRGAYLIERGLVCSESAAPLTERGLLRTGPAGPGPCFDRLLSIGFFRAAIERDSTFAEAWAGIADAWPWIGDVLTPNRLAAEQGRTAARRALALDSTLGGAWSAVGYALMTVDYDWAGAEQVLRHALALDPRATAVRVWLGYLLAATGRLEEAWTDARQAWTADSLDPRVGWLITYVAVISRRSDEMLRWAPRLAAGAAAELRFNGHLLAGHFDSALADAPNPAFRVMALAAAGRATDARDAATALTAASDSARANGVTMFVNPDLDAVAWAAVGDRDRAFEALERSYAVRAGQYLIMLKTAPWFDRLRDDPRYHDLLRRMHLEP
jgi:TolB-like protein